MIRPFGDHVVLRKLDNAEKTAGGLYLAQSAKDPDKIAHRGEILAVGTGRVLDSGVVVSCDSKVGDVVAYSQYGGTEFELSVGGEKLVLISDRDIFGVVEQPVVLEGFSDDSVVTLRGDGLAEVRG